MILELGAGADILRAIGVLYWVAAVLAIALILYLNLGKHWWVKIVLCLAVLWFFIWPPYQVAKKQREELAIGTAKYDGAKAIFDEKCKTAGERIYKTVEGVEAILLLKIRPSSTNADWINPEWPGAALAKESSASSNYDYVKGFLLDRRIDGWPTNSLGKTPNPGFESIEHIDQSGQRTKYWLEAVPRPGSSGRELDLALKKTVATGDRPRIGITYEDDVNPALRKHWIAGTTIKVIDLMSSELLAEKTFWTWDSGLGSQDGFRSPWLASAGNRCPLPPGGFGYETALFADKVLKAKNRK